jgi:hypothetical protein
MIDTLGIIHTIGGIGTSGFSGDGGPADSAQINHPMGLGIDDSAYIYVADSKNQRIRRISPDDSVLVTRSLRQSVGPMLLYPNPSNGLIHVNIPSAHQEVVMISITTTTGSLVYSGKAITNTQTDIQIAEPAGIYNFNAIAPDLKYSVKLIIVQAKK